MEYLFKNQGKLEVEEEPEKPEEKPPNEFTIAIKPQQISLYEKKIRDDE